MKHFSLSLVLLFGLLVAFSSCKKEDPSPFSEGDELFILDQEGIDLSALDDMEDNLILFKLAENVSSAEIEYPEETDEDDEWAFIFELDDDANTMMLLVTANETGEPRSANLVVYGAAGAVNAATKADAQATDKKTITQKGSFLNVNKDKRYGTGFGVDLRSTLNTDGLRGQILNLRKLKSENQPSLEDGTSASIEEQYTGSTQKDVSTKIKVEAEAGFKYAAFSGEMKAAFGSTSSSSLYHEYGLYNYEVRKGYWAVSEDYDIETLKKDYLSAAFIRAIENENFDPKKIIDLYGTHLVMKASVGARINYSMTLDRSKTKNSMDINSSLKVGFKLSVAHASASVSAQHKKQYEENKSAMKEVIFCAGGSRQATELAKTQKIEEWNAELQDENNWSVIGYNAHGALIPLWDFVTDPAKKALLKSAILAYIESGWDVSNAKTKEVYIPLMNHLTDATSIKILKAPGGIPFAELCQEYIPILSEEGPVQVIYPLDPERKPYRSRGFFIGNPNNTAGYITWDDNGVPTYEADENFPKNSRVDHLYIRGYSFTLSTSEATEKATSEDVWVDYTHFLNNPTQYRRSGVVKIGKNTVITKGPIQQILARTGNRLAAWEYGGSYHYFEGEMARTAKYNGTLVIRNSFRYPYDMIRDCVLPTGTNNGWEIQKKSDFEGIVQYVGGTSKLAKLFEGGVSGYDIREQDSGRSAFTSRGEFELKYSNLELNYYFEWLNETATHAVVAKYNKNEKIIDNGFNMALDAHLVHLVRTSYFHY